MKYNCREQNSIASAVLRYFYQNKYLLKLAGQVAPQPLDKIKPKQSPPFNPLYIEKHPSRSFSRITSFFFFLCYCLQKLSSSPSLVAEKPAPFLCELSSRKQNKPSLFFPVFPSWLHHLFTEKEKQQSCSKTLHFPLCFDKEQLVTLLLPLYFSLVEKVQKGLCISLFTLVKIAKKSLPPFSNSVSRLAAAKERENLYFSQLSLCFGL